MKNTILVLLFGLLITTTIYAEASKKEGSHVCELKEGKIAEFNACETARQKLIDDCNKVKQDKEGKGSADSDEIEAVAGGNTGKEE